jgi:CsoR family transcriptional regulator, copper-sensing transcriptional repressor
MSDCCDSQHPSHEAEITRINRAAGQLEGVRKMIDERRYCPDIINQLRAIQSACKSIEANILRRHLEGCVKQAFESNCSDQKIEELIKIFKKLD